MKNWSYQNNYGIKTNKYGVMSGYNRQRLYKTKYTGRKKTNRFKLFFNSIFR